MLCTEHEQEFRAPFACPKCAPGQSQDVDDEGGDADVRSALADGLPTLRNHEAWCVALAKEARASAITYATGDHGPAATGPAYLRVALSARIEAARMAENRERRAWILEIERARTKSGSKASSVQPSRPVPRVGDPIPRGVH